MKVSRQEFLSISGLTSEALDVWLEAEWLIPTESPTEVTFSEVDVARELD